MDWYRQRPYTLRMNSLGHAVGLRVNDDGLSLFSFESNGSKALWECGK
jgi:hypothetical protein